MEKPIFPSKYMRITEGYNIGTHKDSFAIDNADKDSGISNIYAPFTGIIKKIYQNDANEVWLESTDKVEYPDGTKESMRPIWKGTNTINYCQISHMISWNKISISICEENVMKRMRSRCGAKADRILDIIYQDFSIDSCSDCCYKPDCDKLRKNNNDITI